LHHDTVRFADGAAGIGEQRERELVLGFELGLGGNGILADPDHLGVLLAEYGDFITEIAGFLRSAGGVGLGVEKQNDAAALQALEREIFSLVGLERESRRSHACFDHLVFLRSTRVSWMRSKSVCDTGGSPMLSRPAKP